MKIIYTDIEIGDGWLYYDCFINPEQSLLEQMDRLKEDMLQIAFGEGQYVIDIGWYPSFNPKGSFRVFVVRNQNWETPLYDKRASSLKDLDLNLVECVEIVKSRTENFTHYPSMDRVKKMDRNIKFKS